jgi:tRNA threonylcarbamoyladenosine biosynthesis protein TsaB
MNIMNILAFDSCLGAVSAAVRRRGPEGALRREAYEVRAAGHAERLLPMVAEVMDGAGLAFPQLDRIAVTLGPGGFTGVRVGIAAARGLVLATGKPVVAATSLAVMAHRAEEMLAEMGEPLGARRLMVAVDARRGALFVQSFAAGALETAAARLVTAAEAARSLGAGGTIVVGSGATAVAAAAAEAGIAADPRLPDLQPHAGNLAAMAGRLAPVSPVRPLYLRLPDARPQETTAPVRSPA